MWQGKVFDDRAIGPMGEADAYLLDAICRYIKPRIAIEYGGLLGHSLAVMAPHCGLVISVDDNAGEALQEAAKKAGNAEVVKGKMEEYDPVYDGVKPEVDLVFFDASHLYKDNVAAYENVKPVLSPEALILVHDTGDWYKGELPPQWEAWKERRAEYLVHDRQFVEYLREKEGYRDVTFSSTRNLRHGITVLKGEGKW
jgi:predicted O-methyltransferase YrrM